MKKTINLLNVALAWRKARLVRLEKQKEVDLLELEEKALKKHLMEGLAKAKNKSVSNGERLFQITTSKEPTVEDWGKLYKHIEHTGAFELLYRRVNEAAVKEAWEVGEEIPGVGKIDVDKISDVQAKGAKNHEKATTKN